MSHDLRGSDYPDDDGAPDPRVRARLADPAIPVDEVLAGSRLIVALAQVEDEVHEDGSLHRHMGLVSMVNAAGERGLLAFTGLDSLARWDPTARPMPLSAEQAAHSALEHGSAALVVDVMGPVRAAVTGAALDRLAHGAGEAGHAHRH